MLSIPDLAIIGTVALLIFGPDQLPKVMRKTGQVVREIQNTSQSFIREMERAADAHEYAETAAAADVAETAPVTYDEVVAETPHDETPVRETPDPSTPIDAGSADVAAPPAPPPVESRSGQPAP
ncbi:MAG: twin-arginine translocase TatA/TatE family subunit [Candidatus Velthaea sp.]